MKKPEFSTKTCLLTLACTLGVCFGGLFIGVKLEYPAAKIAIPMPVIVLATLWCSIMLAHIMAFDSSRRAAYNEFLRQNTVTLDDEGHIQFPEDCEPGRNQIAAMGE